MTGDDRSQLRPLERAVLRHVDAGLPRAEIAWRFRRSPRYIDRVCEFSRIPRRPGTASAGGSDGLRALERCVLKARSTGSDYAEIAARMRRTPEFVARVEGYANYKLRSQGAG